MRLYLDTAPVIYTVEQVPIFSALVDTRLSSPDIVLVASDLTRLECRVRPLREGNTKLLMEYDTFFEWAVAEIIALSRDVIDLATEIRAQDGVNTPHTIHLAVAANANCEVFLTNDHRLDRFSEIAVVVIQT